MLYICLCTTDVVKGLRCHGEIQPSKGPSAVLTLLSIFTPSSLCVLFVQCDMFITSFSLTWSYLMDCGVEQEGKLNGGETDCTGCSPRVFLGEGRDDRCNFAGWLTTHSQHCLLESWAKYALPKEAAIISCKAGLHLGSLIFRLFRSVLEHLLKIAHICKWELTLFPSILLLSEWKHQWRKQNSPAGCKQVMQCACTHPELPGVSVTAALLAQWAVTLACQDMSWWHFHTRPRFAASHQLDLRITSSDGDNSRHCSQIAAFPSQVRKDQGILIGGSWWPRALWTHWWPFAGDCDGNLFSPGTDDGLNEFPAQSSLLVWHFRKSGHGIKLHLSWSDVWWWDCWCPEQPSSWLSAENSPNLCSAVGF